MTPLNGLEPQASYDDHAEDKSRPASSLNHLLTLPNSESIFTELIFLHVFRKRSWYMPLNICWYFLIKLSWYLGFNFFWYCWLKICWYLGLNICGVDFCSIFDDICWSNFVDIFGSIFADGDFVPYLELIFAARQCWDYGCPRLPFIGHAFTALQIQLV